MTTFTEHTKLAEIVTAQPGLARELETRGLDYCCGGAATLADSCRSSDLDVDTVLAELAAVDVEDVAPAWATMSVAELVDHLESTHHQYLWAELPRLSALADKVVSAHARRHPELNEIAACYATLRADLEPHLTKEERVLFPMARELAAAGTAPTIRHGTVSDPISVLLVEHDTVGELLARLRELTSSYQTPADGCASYAALFSGLAELEADTHLHVHKENNMLFPAVVALEQQVAS
ncbi:MAG: iron-sulfur cluster repair di-iron protein [Ilumatobacter sp.]|uniref:iron-sulfur cluster repair di-iron protein n=1 Tax=Ilumatobacter sp. TaxID=1967498 RepID=UPI0032967D9B